MVKLVVSDIDGTLVTDGTDGINKEIYGVVMDLKEHGVQFAAASGRQFISIRRLFAPIAEELYYISDGGSVLRTCDRILYSRIIDWETAREAAVDILSIEGCDMMLCGKKRTYVLDRNTKMARWLSESYHFDVEELADLQTPVEDEIVKISLYHENDAEGKAAPFFLPKWKDRLQLCCAGDMWIDCSHREANKGLALERLQDILGVSREETAAFGDNSNDCEMLKGAAFSFAMGNARQEVKDCARFIADTNVKDGVLKELRKILQDCQRGI